MTSSPQSPERLLRLRERVRRHPLVRRVTGRRADPTSGRLVTTDAGGAIPIVAESSGRIDVGAVNPIEFPITRLRSPRKISGLEGEPGSPRWFARARRARWVDAGADANPDTVSMLAAAGTVLVGPGAGPFETSSPPANEIQREAASISGRRKALLRHGAANGPLPSVGVIIATNRPTMTTNWVPLMAAQSHRPESVAVVTHGFSLEPDQQEAIESLAPAVTVSPATAEAPLGELLNTAAATSSSDLIVKWDDDDWYGTDHLLDLALASVYSGADIVGKGAEFIYLPHADLTVRRFSAGAETFSRGLSGATLALRRAAFERLEGFEPKRTGEDSDLIDRAIRLGLRTYRTHGFDFLVHRSDSSAWQSDERRFISQSSWRTPGRWVPHARLHSDAEREEHP